MYISTEELQEWLERQGKTIRDLYETNPARRPKDYPSNDAAMAAIRKEGTRVKLKMLEEGKKRIGVGEAAEVIVSTVACVAVPVPEGHSIAIYDYDRKMYTFSSTTVLNDYIVQLLGSSSQSVLSSMMTTLMGLRSRMPFYNPLPRYMVAVGNGIYNCLTKRLEPFTPEYTVLTRIETHLKFGVKAPVYDDGFTLEGMIDSLSNGSPDRQALIGQICKSIITGHSLKPGLFVILGKGGDGKSTFFTMIANMIGADNVAYVNFSEFESPDKMLETMNKKLVLGLDNDVKIYIKKTALLKTMASHEMITLSRKYMNAISVPFTATVVQLCNEFPRIAETGASMKRRIVPFKAERSHYENRTENSNIDNMYIKDRHFLEYALWYFLNEDTNPYFSDFNDTDRKVATDALDAEDLIGQFITELDALGVLSELNHFLPKKHLYAAYEDWMNQQSQGAVKMGARSFGIKISDALFEMGYSTVDNSTRTRPRSLEGAGKYASASWGYLKAGKNLSEAIESNESSGVFTRTHAKRAVREVRRSSRIISALEYFKVDVEIRNYLEPKEDDYDPYDIEHLNRLAEAYEQRQKEGKGDKVIRIGEINQDSIRQDKEEEPKSVATSPPVDIRVALKEKREKDIRTYVEWVEDVQKAFDSNAIDDATYMSISDTASDWTLQVAYMVNDVTMIGVLQSVDDVFESLSLVLDAINIYRDNHILEGV